MPPYFQLQEGKRQGRKWDATKKLLGDLKGVVAVVTAQAWEWQIAAGGDEGLFLLCTTVCHWGGWAHHPSLVWEGAKPVLVGNGTFCTVLLRLRSGHKDEGFVAESILKHKSLEGKAELGGNHSANGAQWKT